MQRVDLYINTGNRDINKAVLDSLHQSKAEIEREFEEPLIWERLDSKQACRIKAERNGNVFDREQWPAMIDYMLGAMVRLDQTFRPKLPTVMKQAN